VRIAYERLIDGQFAVGLGAKGTRIAERPAPAPPTDNLIPNHVAISSWRSRFGLQGA
jgi:hypothetical protein